MHKRLYRALLAVFGDSEPFTASDVFERSRYVASPKFFEMRAAIKSTLGSKFSAIKIGMWLTAHCDIEAGDLRLGGEYDSHMKRWVWYVYKMSTIEEIEAELEVSAKRFIDARKKKVTAGISLEQRLRQLEKDNAALDKHTDKSEAKADKAEAANAKAQQAIDDAKKEEAEEEAEAARKHIYLAPACGHFVFEEKTEKRVRDLCKHGFEASMGYLSPSRFVIWIDGDPDMKELKRVATRFLMTIFESEQPRPTKKARESELIWDGDRQRWLPADYYERDHTSIALIRKALELDRPHGLRDPIRLKPIAEVWNPFNTRGCTLRMISHANADAFDAYMQASKAAADVGF